MKLIFVVIRDTDADDVVKALVENSYRVTRVASTGGFLRRGNVTLMIGVEEDRVQPVFDLIKKACRPAEEAEHQATLFVVDMPYFEQI